MKETSSTFTTSAVFKPVISFMYQELYISFFVEIDIERKKKSFFISEILEPVFNVVFEELYHSVCVNPY